MELKKKRAQSKTVKMQKTENGLKAKVERLKAKHLQRTN